MPTVLKLMAVVFFALAALAATDAVNNVIGFQQARALDPARVAPKFPAFATNVVFAWIYVGIYLAVGLGFWQRRRRTLVLILLLAALVGQWMNVGYPSGFIAAFIALFLLAIPAARASFRN